MSDVEYRALLNLLMCSDPWPVPDNGGHEALTAFADAEARRRGFGNWVTAYHSRDL